MKIQTSPEEMKLFEDPKGIKWLMDVNSDADLDEEDYCLMATEPAREPAQQSNCQKCTQTTWLADSAALCHLCHDDTYLMNVRVIHSPLEIGNGKTMIANKMGIGKSSKYNKMVTHSRLSCEILSMFQSNG
jgi:hypothetical protein